MVIHGEEAECYFVIGGGVRLRLVDHPRYSRQLIGTVSRGGRQKREQGAQRGNDLFIKLSLNTIINMVVSSLWAMDLPFHLPVRSPLSTLFAWLSEL